MIHFPKGRHRRSRGFSLLELLVVIAIMAVMLSLLLPAISGFSSTAGRRGAVNILMNTFEQARVAALESGRPVYVLLYRRNFPELDAVMVVRDPEDGVSTSPLERLTKWTKLPKGVLLHDPGAGILSKAALDPTFLGRISPTPQPASGETINYVIFNETGGVAYPSGPSPHDRKLYLSEGFRGSGGNEQAISDRKKGQRVGGGFEVLSLSHYTGRAQLDITATTTGS
ncbi:MAG: prepilin-type N-terminal cleavage/methylation domain-containing protein [Verrucomicrobia bacterium]|nr:prepilin-type N-terminal cleavage/methylation domain-containing protein [Verrucomicrobiota bacterium]